MPGKKATRNNSILVEENSPVHNAMYPNKRKGAVKDLVDSTLLRSLAILLETGSYSLAAEKLGVTQPAVSLRIRQLERRLGVSLVDRSSRRLQATEAGTLLLAHIPLIDAAHNSALSALKLGERARKTRLKLGASLTACLHFLPPILGQLNVEYPQLRISVVSGNSPECAHQVAQGALDLAIVTLPIAHEFLLKTRVLHDEFVAIAGAGLAIKKSMASADLRTAPLLLLDRSTNSRKIIDEWREKDGFVDPPVMEFDRVETIKELVACGMGYGVVPRISLLGAGARPDLQIADLYPPLHQTWVLVTRKDRPTSRALEVVRDAIVLAGSSANWPRG